MDDKQSAVDKQHLFRILMLAFAALVLFFANMSFGSIDITFEEIGRVLMGYDIQSDVNAKIIHLIRLPKALSAVLAGMALSVAGLQMQTLFRNPLAGPTVLGLSSGASLGVAFVMLASGAGAAVMNIKELGVNAGGLIVLASTLGAASVMLVILLVSIRIRDNVVLLIIGMMVGNLTYAIVSVWQYFSHPELIKDYLLWSFGSLGGVSLDQIPVFSFSVCIGLIGTLLLSKSLNILMLGEQYASSLGVNVKRVRVLIIIFSSLLAGAVTGYCGPISFIGIACPHIARSIIHTNDHRWLSIASALCGTIILLACDMLSSLPGNSVSLPINAITAMIGSPIVIAVIVKSRNLQRAF
ncbi:iron ABC transporter permease [Aureibacter tunicatorum]|uniref:Iron complex transport system permease protein n=1 Tax=Aureibacter tunicatorum TaxID=866807 RepID=A0AAE4BVU5_9BACT|nr:iron ABC transporter permease [Aureibacter tunicatorum]MDR6242053.1 iron complex transport system permease protein [Aureibacter tunicatorum]BDD03628.1 iron(III) ABC transporter permease [Aureibacter tunicatorum]